LIGNSVGRSRNKSEEFEGVEVRQDGLGVFTSDVRQHPSSLTRTDCTGGRLSRRWVEEFRPNRAERGRPLRFRFACPPLPHPHNAVFCPKPSTLFTELGYCIRGPRTGRGPFG
jgi:hypothetical protein